MHNRAAARAGSHEEKKEKKELKENFYDFFGVVAPLQGAGRGDGDEKPRVCTLGYEILRFRRNFSSKREN